MKHVSHFAGLQNHYEIRHAAAHDRTACEVAIFCDITGEKLHTQFNIQYADSEVGFFVHVIKEDGKPPRPVLERRPIRIEDYALKTFGEAFR